MEGALVQRLALNPPRGCVLGPIVSLANGRMYTGIIEPAQLRSTCNRGPVILQTCESELTSRYTPFEKRHFQYHTRLYSHDCIAS